MNLNWHISCITRVRSESTCFALIISCAVSFFYQSWNTPSHEATKLLFTTYGPAFWVSSLNMFEVQKCLFRSSSVGIFMFSCCFRFCCWSRFFKECVIFSQKDIENQSVAVFSAECSNLKIISCFLSVKVVILLYYEI